MKAPKRLEAISSFAAELRNFQDVTGEVAMIGGIFETIGKTLGIGKEKYFLELDDAAEEVAKGIKGSAASATKAAQSAVESAKEATIEVAEKAQSLVSDTADEAKDKAKSAADDVADEAKKTAAAADEAVAKGKKKAAKTVAKGKEAANNAAPEAPEAPEAPVQAAPPSGPSVEDLIASAIAATEPKVQTDNDGNVMEEVKNFSTDYLETPSRSSRRRPGPSLSPFKDMAKETNPRLKG